MARIHARKRGKSGSKKPPRSHKPKWVKASDKEIEELIVKLAKEGKRPSEIGLILRDEYGIPGTRYTIGKKLVKVLKEKNLVTKMPQDLMDLMKKAVKLRKHIERHPKDTHNKRALQLTEAKIKRLVKYYKKEGVIEKSWYYNPEEAAILIK